MVKKETEMTELKPEILVKHIRERKAEMEQLFVEKEKALKDAPGGKLRIIRNKRTLQFYYRRDASERNGSYIKRSQNSLAAALMQKEYDCKLVSELKAEIMTLGRLLDDYRPERINEIYLSLHNNRKPFVHPAILLDEDYIKRWMSVEFEKKTYDENMPEYYTAKGERVRSKSEVIIAESLSRFKIPYRYEYPIYISGIGTVHPDFTCLNVCKRKEYIWEHNGMMSDSDYAEYAINRIEKYSLSGYDPGENLILSFESASRPLSVRIIEHYIRKYLL